MGGLSSRWRQLGRSLIHKPGYTLMRGFARFSIVRVVVVNVRRLFYGPHRYVESFNEDQCGSVFSNVDASRIVSDLKSSGVAFGLRLPEEIVVGIRCYCESAVCYADRDPKHGFRLSEHEQAESALNKNVLVGQYFNTLDDCPEIARLVSDPVLNKIAAMYLQSRPTFVGANLWWTFPVDASEEDRSRHAHLFHRDVDDFKFFKFFFYLTDVEKGDGAHVCVMGSQGKPPVRNFADRWNLRRYTDDEVESTFPVDSIVEIVGPAGEGFAEDTWCLHKGQTPIKKPRLLLQLQFALFDYGVMNDHKDDASLGSLT